VRWNVGQRPGNATSRRRRRQSPVLSHSLDVVIMLPASAAAVVSPPSADTALGTFLAAANFPPVRESERERESGRALSPPGVRYAAAGDVHT
jgi:hypothetical protein